MNKLGTLFGINREMRYELLYLASFVEDMRLITAFLSRRSDAAGRFEDEVERQVGSLSEFPGRFACYERIPVFHRMQVLYDYQVFYTIDEDKKQVRIHHILHGHRNIQKFLRYEASSSE